MQLPHGQLIRSRVVSDLGTPLSMVLREKLTGYACLEPQDALLLDVDGTGVLTFEQGVPVVAYHTGTDNGGPPALDDIAVSGPYRVELYDLADGVLADIHASEQLRVPPGMPAERLVGDPELIEQTRAAAPDERVQGRDSRSPLDAVEEFLTDEESISRIRERARADAKTRAEEWGFDVSGRHPQP